VRINPYELHVDDPEFYDELYSGTSKRRDKWEWSAKMFGNYLSMLSTAPHDLHRMRRAALNPYFSKKSVMRLERVIQSHVRALCERLGETQKSEEPVNLSVACFALTTDIITEYSFGKPSGYLTKPDFGAEWPALLRSIAELGHLLKQFGWLYPIMNAMPAWLVSLIKPEMIPLVHFRMV
jgi:cytochrome P450